MDEILLDYRIRSHTPVAGFELVRRGASLGRPAGGHVWAGWSRTPSPSSRENRRLFEQLLDAVPALPVRPHRLLGAARCLRVVPGGAGACAPARFPGSEPTARRSAPAAERFRLFGHGKDLPAGPHGVRPLRRADGARARSATVARPVPPLVPGLRDRERGLGADGADPRRGGAREARALRRLVRRRRARGRLARLRVSLPAQRRQARAHLHPRRRRLRARARACGTAGTPRRGGGRFGA